MMIASVRASVLAVVTGNWPWLSVIRTSSPKVFMWGRICRVSTALEPALDPAPLGVALILPVAALAALDMVIAFHQFDPLHELRLLVAELAFGAHPDRRAVLDR